MGLKSKPENMVGKECPTDDEACISAECFCLSDPEGICVLTLHVEDGEACICVKENGEVRHVKVSELLAMIPQVTKTKKTKK